MNKKVIRVKYCLLGYGYASLIAYHKILQKGKHEDVLILQKEGRRQIFTIEHQGFHFSPLPIFPVEESELYNSDLFKEVPKQDPIKVNFSELTNFESGKQNIKEGSLAEFMLSREEINQRLCLGLKQWGEPMLSLPYGQVRSKIERHYITKSGNTRAGYIHGKSLYKYAVDKLSPNVLNHSDLQKIDVQKKELHTKSKIIHYDKLISTIPLHILLELCGLNYNHDTSYQGCYFSFFKYDKGLSKNKMIYDCDYSSEVIRIFSITDNFLLAQLNDQKCGMASTAQIKNRIQELAPNIRGLEFARELHVPMCYPLELISDPITLENITYLKINNVLPFGRFGNWEYSDLHELDWASVL